MHSLSRLCEQYIIFGFLQPPLSTQVGDIPRSTFNFDFDFEKKILAEAEKESQNWSRLGLENLPSRLPEQTNTVLCISCNLVNCSSKLWLHKFLKAGPVRYLNENV